jgi:hypothetical protein
VDYSVCSGDRDDLIATLRRFQADRAERHETRRADEAREAADLLEGGAELAYFERIIYVVGESDRWSVWSGTREQVVAELSDAAVGWDHQRKPALTLQASDAVVRVRGGADMARVGHWLYLVRG